MKEKNIKKISNCTECGVCLDVCCTYYATGNSLYSPLARLKIADKFFKGKQISRDEVEAIYYCTECGRCDEACPEGICISGLMADAKVELVQTGSGPLDRHDAIISGILIKRNAVNGDPEKRLDWLPEEFRKTERFEEQPSETLFYAGCLPSYLVQESASDSYRILKKAGLDFMILQDEFCCGIYPYNAGRLDIAGDIFQENDTKFRELGIKRIIVSCAGCYRCFSDYYQRVLGETDFEVFHIVQIIHDMIKSGNITLRKAEAFLTFHDSCRLGRKAGIYDEPRNILKECGAVISELEQNRENAYCCGAGSGVRSINRDMSMRIGSRIIEETGTEDIISSCPFCIFNLRYVNHKVKGGKRVRHITSAVLESMEG